MKKGISLIVLVITIIVMIILAASVVITLSNTSVINRASEAVDLSNEAQVQDLAALTWADAYMDNLRGQDLIDEVTTKLIQQGITADKWNITVTDTGVSVISKNQTITGNYYILDGVKYDWIHTDVSWNYAIENGYVTGFRVDQYGIMNTSKKAYVVDSAGNLVKGEDYVEKVVYSYLYVKTVAHNYGASAYYVEGMTWAEFIKSPFNYDESIEREIFTCEDNYVLFTGEVTEDKDGNYVKGTDLIRPEEYKSSGILLDEI